MSQTLFILCAFFCALVTISCTHTWTHYALAPQANDFEPGEEVSNLSNNTKYCFHFTWMGRNFNNRTFKNIRNKTCSQYNKDKKTLCINPMVATFQGGEPDLQYILDNHATAATCRLTSEQVCAKYTHFYNGIVSYQTRYCTQVNIDLEGPMKSGCIQEVKGSEVIEVCACRSEYGPQGICNSALSSFRPIISTALSYLIYLVFLK